MLDVTTLVNLAGSSNIQLVLRHAFSVPFLELSLFDIVSLQVQICIFFPLNYFVYLMPFFALFLYFSILYHV